MYADEARAESINASEVLVTAGLIDCAFAAQFSFLWNYRNAVGRDAAITTAFTNQFIDEGALGRIWEGSTFSSAAFLGSTGLIVNQGTDAGVFT